MTYQNTITHSVVTVVADWDDLDAGMERAMTFSETAVLGRVSSEHEVVYDLISIHDERGTLTARRVGDDVEGVPITLEVDFPPSGANTGNRVLAIMADRLQELRGVETLPE